MDPSSMPALDVNSFAQMITAAINGAREGKWGVVFVPVLSGLVWILRNSIPRWKNNPVIKDWLPLITAIMGAAGGAAAALATGALPAIVIGATAAGFMAGFMATGGYEFAVKLPSLFTSLLALFSSKWKAKRQEQIEERKTVEAAKTLIKAGSLALDSSGRVTLNGKPFGIQP